MIVRMLSVAVLLLTAGGPARALEETPEALAEVLNYRAYSPAFASAGQPTREQLEAIADAGFERVVYIAFSDGSRALDDEDVVVESLGMSYLHIPVRWDAPGVEEFDLFATFMAQDPDAPTLLHCQVNARATAFGFLYRVIHQNVAVAEAKADMNTVWQPNATWRDFIFEVLARHGISPHCDGCDWTPSVTD